MNFSRSTQLLLAALILTAPISFAGGATKFMSFVQNAATSSTQKFRFTDNGVNASTFNTWNGTVLGTPMDIDFTFLGSNKLFSIGTVKAAKLTISAQDGSALAAYSNAGSTATQLLQNLNFSIKDTTGTVNYLSATGGYVFLTQFSSNSASYDITYSDSLQLTSDAFVIDKVNDSTQQLTLTFGPIQLPTFGDANHNTVLDTYNMNGQGMAFANIATVPEPGSAILVFASLALGLRRRR